MELTSSSIITAEEQAKQETSMKQAATLPPASPWFLAWITLQRYIPEDRAL
jgi:hypothetical protein